jgi:glycosyltransferase involved in cell wall biosynthesis
MKYLFIQSQPSQLDATFYVELEKLIPGESLVILFNDHGSRRRDIDPELGLVPVLPNIDEGYPHEWIASGKFGIFSLLKRIANFKRSCVVVQDQKWLEKIAISLFCRLLKIPVAMRSDKNRLSIGARVGFSLWVERFLVARLFNVLCPVSELTTAYYDWTKRSAILLFSYCTNTTKFKRPHDVCALRRLIRSRSNIPGGAFVFLSVAKFIDRENPRAVIDAFRVVVAFDPNAWLLMVGAGPQFDEIRQYVDQAPIPNICFAGYVPYAELEQYFFAADVFVHLAKNEPWGISPQDALIAEIGLITSEKVGSGVHHLQDKLSRFVVPIGDLTSTAERMIELIGHGNPANLFQPAKANALNGFTADSLAIQWAQRPTGQT